MNLSMINQARKLKAELEKADKELKKSVIEVSAEKGAIKIEITGKQQLKSITLSPDIVNPEKVDNLEKMLLKAINGAINDSQKMAAKQLKGLTGGLKIPGLG